MHRLALRFDCDMNLVKFPLDNQTCPIYIGSCNKHLNLKKRVYALKTRVNDNTNIFT